MTEEAKETIEKTGVSASTAVSVAASYDGGIASGKILLGSTLHHFFTS